MARLAQSTTGINVNEDSREQPEQPEQPVRKPGGLLRSTAVVASMTLLSRVLGLARDVIFARFFGAGPVMDAFFVAFKIPNIFRRFFAEGAFSQSFVPVFAEYDENRPQAEVKELADRVAGTLGLILFVFTAVGVLAAPVLISVAGMGWLLNPDADSAEKFDLAVVMLRFTFPYLLFISLTALAGAILNTYHRFAAPGICTRVIECGANRFCSFGCTKFFAAGNCAGSRCFCGRGCAAAIHAALAGSGKDVAPAEMGLAGFGRAAHY